jgi:photosystem II stability/assembly factor-like uncharacterized protein
MHIQILAFIFLFQSLVACQQGMGKTQVSVAGIAFQSVGDSLEKPSASNLLFQSTDDGQTWQDASAGLPVDMKPGCLFVDGSHIFLGAENGLYQSTNPPAALLWEQQVFPFRDVLDISANGGITEVYPGRAGLYASSYGNGLYQKQSGADIWTPIGGALKDNTIRTLVETPDGTVFIGCNSGIYKSANGGKAWKQVSTEYQINSLTVAADGSLIAGSSLGLLRSADGGGHWDQVLTKAGLGFSIRPIEGGLVAIMAEGVSNWLYTSVDNGKTWQRMEEHLSQEWPIYDLKQVGQYLFCNSKAGVFRSSDRGKSWKLVLAAENGKPYNMAVSGKVVYVVRVWGC